MDVNKYLLKNPKLLLAYQGKREFFVDFETLTKDNIKKNKYANYVSKIYLWGIKTLNLDCLWGTEIEDFWSTILLIGKKRNAKLNAYTKIFYFVNFSYDYQFLKNFLSKQYVWKNVNYIDWLEIKQNYQKNWKLNKKNNNCFHLIMNGKNVLMLTLLSDGTIIQIKCLYRLTSLSVKKMETSLVKNNFPTPKKLTANIDYNLVDKVYKRKEFFKLVYGGKLNYERNYNYMGINKNSKYGYLLAYIKNDVEIPFLYFKYFKKLIEKTNISFAGTNLIFKNGKVLYTLGREVSKEKRRVVKKKYGAKIIKSTEKLTICLKKIIVKNIPSYNKNSFIFYWTDLKKSYENYFNKIELKEIWIQENFLNTFENFNFEFIVLDTKYFQKIKIKSVLSHNSITTSGLVFEGFKRFFGKKKFTSMFGGEENNLLSYPEYLVLNRAYQGGLTNFNINNRYSTEKFLSIDINSAYPFEMLKQLPYGKVLYKKPKIGRYIAFINVNISFFELKDPENVPPFFPKWKVNYKIEGGAIIDNPRYLTKYEYVNEQGVVFGKFNASFTEKEWNFYNKHYKIIYDKKSLKYYYFYALNYAERYIEKLKNIKLNAKSEGEYNFGKLLMNGLYGKFSQRVFLDEKFIVNLDRDNIKKLKKELILLSTTYSHTDEYGVKKFQLSQFKLMNLLEIFNNPSLLHKKNYAFLTFLNEKRTVFYFRYYSQIEGKWLRFRHIGAVITANTRIKLLSTIINFGWKNVRYFDTDSVYINWNDKTKKIYQLLKIQKKLEIHDEKLGAWCNEKIGYMKILGAKQYQLFVEKEYKNGKWKYINDYYYSMAGLKNAYEIFKKIGHNQFKKGTILKNASSKTFNLDSGAVIENLDFILTEGGN